MSCRHQLLHKAEGGVTPVIIRFELCLACVNPHPHINRDFSPRFILQSLLGLDRGFERVACLMECGAEGIANDLKYKPIVAFNCFTQKSMMTRLGSFPRSGILTRQLRAVFDICKEK